MNLEWAAAGSLFAAVASLLVLAATWRRAALRTWALGAVAPGAVLLVAARAGTDVERGLVAVSVAAGITAAVSAQVAARWYPPRVLPAMLTASAGAAYLAVPDTEIPAAACGALAVAVVAGGAAGPPAVAVALAVAYGASGRPASAIGALAAFGLVLVVPLARVRSLSWPALIGAHGALALAAARTSGVERDASTATARAAALLTLSTALVMLYDVARMRSQRSDNAAR